MTMRWIHAVALMGVLAGCGAEKGGSDSPSDGSVDARVPDMGRREGGIPDLDMGEPPEPEMGPPQDADLDVRITPDPDMGPLPDPDMGTPPDPDMGPLPDPDMGPLPDPDMGPAPDMGVPACEAPVLPTLTGQNIVSGTATFRFPVFVTQAPGSTDTLWVVEKGGLIRLVRGGAILATPFLDITSTIGSISGANDERGLLGLAFHPDYATNRRFFVGYRPTGSGVNVVAEYQRTMGDADRASNTEVARLVAVTDREGNHNGGMVAFGPDGYLYAGLGDEGGSGDAHGTIGNALDLTTLHGKILRLDVDASASGYAAAGNPFSSPTGLPQIWAYGLRNPWRFSFDRLTGELYVGDVGQNVWEEISVAASGAAGLNYGWRAYEGDVVFDTGTVPLVPVHHEPVVTIRHGSMMATLRSACSITGGYVYRGSAIPALSGVYLFGDYCSGDIAAFRYCDGAATGLQRAPGLTGEGSGVASFGQDNAGEVYIVYQNDGRVVRIVAE